MKKYVQLIAQIIRRGTLKSSGQNFNLARAENLKNLQEFVPLHVLKYYQDGKLIRNAQRTRHTLVRQAAFIKYAFRNDGGHLSTQNLSYIRIPKAANTSISYALLSKRYLGLKAKNPDESQINFLSDVNLLPALKAKTGIVFTVVRNPFARLVSVYRDFFEKNHGQFLYADYLFGILKPEITFAEFVNRISKIPGFLNDQHFRPQHYFVKPYEARGVTVNIYKLEDAAVLGSFLLENGMELHHRNKSQTDYDYTQYYNAELLEHVYSMYQKDIKKFGYQEVYEELRERFKNIGL